MNSTTHKIAENAVYSVCGFFISKIIIERTIRKCAEAGVTCSICGQAGSVPHIVEKLVGYGITSVSSNADAVEEVRKTVARAEKKIILNAARKQME